MNAVSTILCLVSIAKLSGASVGDGKVEFSRNENERIVDFTGKSKSMTVYH